MRPYADGWLFRKVRGWEYGYKEVSDNFLFRTAEAYLNAAEAAAYTGDEGTARNLLKELRDYRMIDSKPITESGESLVTLIRAERQRELCLEGHRWFDLRRYTVCEKYPYSENNHPLLHVIYMEWPRIHEILRVAKNDPAYTLALPQEVRDFQNSLGPNNRPVRTNTDAPLPHPKVKHITRDVKTA